MIKSSITIHAINLEQANLIKGVGIFLIILHNIWHLLPPELGMNQGGFNPSRVENHIAYLLSFPEEILVLILSFWGHFGVELFIFLTAYGVTISLTRSPRTYSTFLYQRFSNLYISFLVCILFYIALNIAYHDLQYLFSPEFPWKSLVWKLLLISNFVPGEGLEPVGPWWFIPFIFQTYLILPGLIWLFQRFGGIALLIIATMGYILEASFLFGFPNLYLTPIGHLPLICLGIFVSLKKEIVIPKWLLLGTIFVFIASQYNFYIWLIGDLSITIILLVIISYFISSGGKHTLRVRFFSYLGSLSLYLFLVNGFVRIPFLKLAPYLEGWWGTILIGILVLFVSVVMAVLLRWSDDRFRQFLMASRLAIKRT